MSTSSQFGIVLPSFSAQVNGPPGWANLINPPQLVSKIQPITGYSDVYLGHVRKIQNISATMDVGAWYQAPGNWNEYPALAVSALPTLVLYRNTQPVFTTSAQIDLVPNTFTTSQWSAGNAYGIYADLVNPIILHNSDSLSVQMMVYGTPLYIQNPYSADTTSGAVTPTTHALNQLQAILTQGNLYYTEEKE